MGFVCSPRVGINDMESLWGGTWSYDQCCMREIECA